MFMVSKKASMNFLQDLLNGPVGAMQRSVRLFIRGINLEIDVKSNGLKVFSPPGLAEQSW